MVPYADMLNHYRPRETKWQFEDSRQAFTIISLRQIGSGGQIYDSYGQKCNHRFLLNYGFSVENNEEADGFNPNEVPLLFQLKNGDPLYQQKVDFWRKEGSLPVRRVRVCVGENENSRAMLQLLRIIEADKDDFYALTQSPGSSSRSLRDATFPLNEGNEMRAMELLQRMTQDYLSRYPTTYEEDVRRLTVRGSGELVQFTNERHAVIQIKGEKEVLLFLKDFADTTIEVLKMLHCDRTEYETSMDRIADSKHPIIAHYCSSTLGRLRTAI